MRCGMLVPDALQLMRAGDGEGIILSEGRK